MFDHVEFGVQDYEQSLKFYSSCVPELGIELLFTDKKGKSFGFGKGEWTGFLLFEKKLTAPKMHIAFKATSKEQVNEFYHKAVANGGKCNGEPGYRKDYGKGYYAAFVYDPDGHNIEALFRDIE